MFKLFEIRNLSTVGPTIAFSNKGQYLRLNSSLAKLMKDKDITRVELFADEDTQRIAIRQVADGLHSLRVTYAGSHHHGAVISCRMFLNYLRGLGHLSGRWTVQWNEEWKQFEISLRNDRIVPHRANSSAVRTPNS